MRIERGEKAVAQDRLGPSDSELRQVVQAWVAAGGPTAVESVVELSGGLYNSCFQLMTTRGDRAVLRVAPAEADQRPSELHLMRNQYASVPFLRPIADLIPSTLFADFTHQIIDRDYLIQSHVESFNSRVRDECLNINIFWSLAQARVIISDWKEDYNHRRRHSSLCYQTPAVYAAACTHR